MCIVGTALLQRSKIMSDYINREDAIKAIKKDIMGGLNYESILNRLPTADVEPVRHGHWILCRLNSLHLDWRNFECSVCRMNRIRRTGEVLNYCPNCGARMDRGEQEHEF